MISTDNTTVVSYINKQGGRHSPNLCVEVWRILHWCLEYDIVIRVCHIPGKFNILADHLSRLDRPLKTEWALDHLVGNAIFQCSVTPMWICLRHDSHKLPLYVSPVPDNHALMTDALWMDWNCLHAYAFPPTILMPSVLVNLPGISVLYSSYSPSVASTLVVLRGVTTISISSNPLFPRLLTQTSKWKVSASKSPITTASRLGVIKQSIRHKKFSQRVADIVSKSRQESTQRVYDAKWIV